MPLLGKIVVIKRNGTDGTEFPLTASCLFGRKLDCDIRIQLPQVSKEHCRIELNENKELILTNLSSVNPTRINGEVLQQAERLKHGDLITIIDRSFRFEYPPPPTPKKKRLSTSEKGEAVKVLTDQQVRSTPGSTDKKKSELSDSCLKDGSNLPSSLDQISEVTKGDGKQTDSTMSPFTELYHMVKRDLASKSPWKAAAPPRSPIARPQVDKDEPKKILGSPSVLPKENNKPATPKSDKKKRRSSNAKSVDSSESTESSITAGPVEDPSTEVQAATAEVQETPGKQKRRSSGPVTSSEANATPVSQKNNPQATPQKFSADEVAQQILLMHSSAEKTPKSPKSRRSVDSQPQSPAVTPKSPATTRLSSGRKTPTQPQTPTTELEVSEAKQSPRTSPRANAGKRFQVQDVVNEIATSASDDKANGQVSKKKHKYDDLPTPAPKRKRVSFGGQLSPELFDKRLPPDSPLRRGATPGRRSLSIFQKPQSLLRRASTIGLMGFQLAATLPESPSKKASPRRASSSGKSPKGSPAKTPSPAKKSPRTKAKTPSPKNKAPSPKNNKTPPKTATPSSSPATPKTPKSSKRVSNASFKTPSPSDGSMTQSPAVQGRFSITRIPTPSPDKEGVGARRGSVSGADVDQECVTPKTSLRRSGVKSSARKTPKSALKSAFEVIRSRRSGASCANLKVVSSWADIVKFGQVKPQMEGGTKKTATKQKAAKQTKMAKPKTPARKLNDDCSTGHAASPATIVIGKACMRATQAVGAAPKIVPNIALFKKDMKMDEDLSGVADIFKTPAHSKRKSLINNDEYSKTPLGVPVSALTEMSVMNTPEESGEMLVSPMSVASSAKLGCYNSEAITRLLQDEQDVDLIDSPQTDGSNDLPANNTVTELQMTAEDQMEVEEAEPRKKVQTPQREPEPLECLTGVKKLLRTPKQRSEPIEDLRGKLFKTPKEAKPAQEENFEGVKELLNTPKQKGTPVEDMAELKSLIKTPKKKNSPVVCAVGLKKLMKTPKAITEQEEDLTGVKQLMQTPKLKGEPVEHAFGVKRLMKTPKQKSKPVEDDLTGIQEMMKTPIEKSKPVEDLTDIQVKKSLRQKAKPVEEDLTGIRQMMKTPKEKSKPVEEDLTGIQEMMKTPKEKSKPVEDLTDIKEKKTLRQKAKPVEEDLTGIQQLMKTPKQKSKAVEDLTGIKQMMKTPKEKSKPVEEDLTGIQEMMKTPKEKSKPVEDLTDIQEKKTLRQKAKPVEEDLTGIQQLMKTPKQKREPVEDLTGMKRLLQTPKEKGQPVEKEFGISRLVKTPRQRRGEVEEDFTGLAELVSEPISKTASDVAGSTQNDASESVEVQEPLASEVLAVEDGEESEDKENICPVEATVAVQAIPQEEEASSVEMSDEDMPVQESISENVSIAVDATPCLLASTKEEKAETCSPVKKAQRGGRVKTVQESQKIDSVSQAVVEVPEESTAVETAPMKVKRGKAVLEEPVHMPSPVRKSARERVPKVPPSEDVKEVSECPSVTLKPRRGRKADQGVESVSLNAVAASEATQPSAELEVSLKSPAPLTKAKRGQRSKPEAEDPRLTASEEPQELNMPAVEKEEPVPESELESSAVTDVPVKTNTRTRRGKQTKKESLKTTLVEEPTDSTLTNVEADIAASEAVVVAADELPQVPVVKPGRGRRAKPGALKDLPVVDEPKADTELKVIEPEQKQVLPAVRSGRGTRSNQPKPEVIEDVHDQPPAAETKAAVTESEGTVVKNVRGGRRTKQPKQPQVSEDAQKNVEAMSEVDHDITEQSETPVVKSTRGKRTAVVREEPEGPVKRGRRAVAAEVPPPVVKPTRGRKAAVQAQQKDVPEDATAADELVKDSSKAVTKPESQPDETPALQASSDATVCDGVEDAVSEVPAKRGRGRYAKKAKALSDDHSVSQAEDAAVEASVESKRNTSKKAVNWNSDLVTCKNIEELTAPAAEEEPQQRRSGKKSEPAVEASTEDPSSLETKQSADPPAKGRRGRAAKKQDPLVERSEATAEEEPQQQKSLKEAEPVAKGSDEDAPVSEAKQSVDPPVKGRRGRAAKKQDEPLAKKSETAAEKEPQQQKPVAKDSEEDASTSEAKPSLDPPAKGRRGRVAKKQAEPLAKKSETSAEEEPQQQIPVAKDSEEDASGSVDPPAKGRRGRVAKKQAEPLAKTSETSAEEEPQQQKSVKKAEPVVKDSDEDSSVSEAKQSVDPPAKGRRGRVTKKQDEPLAEKPEMSVEEVTPVVRRGRAGASLVSKTDEVAAGPKRGSKRKAAEETIAVDSLLKRQKGKAATVEPEEAEVSAPSRGRRAAAKETPAVASEQSEQTSKKEENKPVRGKRKTAQEDSVQSEDPVSEVTTRRGQKSAGTDAPSAPVRRTRRK